MGKKTAIQIADELERANLGTPEFNAIMDDLSFEELVNIQEILFNRAVGAENSRKRAEAYETEMYVKCAAVQDRAKLRLRRKAGLD